MDAQQVAHSHLEQGDPLGWFEALYEAADDGADDAAVPWARLVPDPRLVDWLDAHGDELDGLDALVVGCGLGDDAAEVTGRGARTVAFDVAPTAVERARERFPEAGVDWRVADLLAAPAGWRRAFGLVVEVRTVQSLPAELRQPAMEAIAGFVAPGGWLVHVGLLADSKDRSAIGDRQLAGEAGGPPWAVAPFELAAYRRGGLGQPDLAHPPDPGPVMEVRLTMRRPPER